MHFLPHSKELGLRERNANYQTQLWTMLGVRFDEVLHVILAPGQQRRGPTLKETRKLVEQRKRLTPRCMVDGPPGLLPITDYPQFSTLSHPAHRRCSHFANTLTKSNPLHNPKLTQQHPPQTSPRKETLLLSTNSHVKNTHTYSSRMLTHTVMRTTVGTPP